MLNTLLLKSLFLVVVYGYSTCSVFGFTAGTHKETCLALSMKTILQNTLLRRLERCQDFMELMD